MSKWVIGNTPGTAAQKLRWHKIKDGSKKILEIHFSRFKRLQYGRKGMWGFIDRLRSKVDLKVASSYDSFVVLTHEDKGYWGELPNMIVIPNASTFSPTETSSLNQKQAIAVGRYSHQKGFDDLIRAWSIVVKYNAEWKLNIYGEGEQRDLLEDLIKRYQLTQNVFLKSSVKDIGKEYLSSSLLVMTSRYEGLPMVLLEAQSYGLPIVSYACKCGPRDIITDGKDGFLVPEGDIEQFAKDVVKLIDNQSLIRDFGEEALKNTQKYKEDNIMEKWTNLFQKLTDKG